MTAFTESIVEQAALAWLEAAGWQIGNGAEIAPVCARLSGATTATAMSGWIVG